MPCKTSPWMEYEHEMVDYQECKTSESSQLIFGNWHTAKQVRSDSNRSCALGSSPHSSVGLSLAPGWCSEAARALSASTLVCSPLLLMMKCGAIRGVWSNLLEDAPLWPYQPGLLMLSERHCDEEGRRVHTDQTCVMKRRHRGLMVLLRAYFP